MKWSHHKQQITDRPIGMSEWKHYIQIWGGGEILFIVLVEIKAKNMIKDLETNMY